MARFDMGSAAASMAPAQPGPESFFDLGILYSTGREVAADLVAAHKWFNLACANGFREAATYRAEVAQEMTAEQIAEAQRAAREYLGRH